MSAEIAVHQKPEDEELAKKKAELAQLEAELAERELALASLHAELASFEGRYLRVVGILYAELDKINAQIAERIARHVGTQEASQNAVQAQQQAQESYSAAYGEAAKAPEFKPTADLKRLYREVAKRVHPDLTSDAADRAKRERLMAEANRAYEHGDADALKRILEEYESSPESVIGEGVAAELVRVIRKIRQVKNRLAKIESEIERLTQSEVNQLSIKASEVEREGRDLLSEMAANVKRQVRLAQQRLEALDSGGAAGTRS
jgi:hypothetical protein